MIMKVKVKVGADADAARILLELDLVKNSNLEERQVNMYEFRG